MTRTPLRKFIFLIGFFLGFTVEVQVEAAERVQLRPVYVPAERLIKTSSAVLEEPAKCLDQVEVVCAIRVGHRRKLTIGQAESRELVFGDGSIVIRLAPDRFRLIEGFVRVRGESLTTVEITSRTSIVISGEAFVERFGDSVTVTNTGVRKVVLKSAEEEDGLIASGLEVHFDRPDVRTGKTQPGAPLPLDLERQVVREAKLHEGSKETFQARVEILLALRKQAAFKAAEIHEQIVNRKLASIELESQERIRKAAIYEARNRELRALFRRKVLNVE
jgi:hypothetical protein